MNTTMETITFTTVRSATVHATNASDADRAFDISADAVIENGALTAITAGTVTHAESGRYLGSFDRRRDGALRLDLPAPDAERVAVLEAVMAFNAALERKAGSEEPVAIPVTAT